MIVKQGNSYVVKDSSGKKTLGTHPTKEKAVQQLRAIEINKKQRFKKLSKYLKKNEESK